MAYSQQFKEQAMRLVTERTYTPPAAAPAECCPTAPAPTLLTPPARPRPGW